MTTTWETLLTAALLGTERRELQIPTDAPAPLHQLATDDAERLLLAAAGIMSVYQRAGYTPAADHRALGMASPDETLPVCSLRAASRLMQLLVHPDQYRLLIGEWLHIVAGKGKRVPYFFLPDVMQSVRRDNALMAMLIPALGERGRWLVLQNPEWGKYQKALADTSLTWIQALFTRAVPPEEIARTEAEALEGIRTKPIEDRTALAAFSQCRHLWSDALIEAFLARMIAIHNKKVYQPLDSDAASLFVASVPRGSLYTVMQRLKSAENDERKYVFFRTVTEMLDLRQHMLQELSHE